MRSSRRVISWVSAALKDFSKFPDPVQSETASTLTVVAEGHIPENVKPLRGFDEAVFEIRLRGRGTAYRVVFVLGLDDDVWAVHAFQKKSTKGIKTPLHHIDLIHDRIKRMKEVLNEKAKGRT